MKMNKTARRAAGTAALMIGLGLGVTAGMQPAQAQSGSGAEIGTLNCTLTGSSNFIVRSTQEFDCEFKSASGEVEAYKGTMTRTGLDLTVKSKLHIAWAVLAPTEIARKPKSLSGTYVGGSSEIALGAGVGANVLVGGGSNSFTLQPVSVAGVVGAGASLTVSKFVLE